MKSIGCSVQSDDHYCKTLYLAEGMVKLRISFRMAIIKFPHSP
jgi:hypothetical protein